MRHAFAALAAPLAPTVRSLALSLALALPLLAGCASIDDSIPQPPMDQVESTKPRRQVDRWRAEQQPARTPIQQEAAGNREVKIALMVPLSGPAAGLGQQMLDAATLALEDKHRATPPQLQQQTRVILLPKDTPADAAGAQRAAQSALREGADIFLGPLFSTAVETVHPLARGEGVNIVTFSNNQKIAKDGVYLMGFLPEQQVERIVDYATSARGIRRYAALLPDDDYGRAVAASLKQEARERKADVVAVSFYAPDAASMESEIQRLLAAASSNAISTLQALPADARPGSPAYGFQALLIPEGGERLNRIAQGLKNLKIDTSKFLLLGSGQWDDEITAKDGLFKGALYASTDPARVERYQRHYKSTFGNQPERLTSLAYDATALALTLAYSPAARHAIESKNLFSTERLTDPTGYNGPVDGIFRFKSNGIPERGLAVLEVTGGKDKRVVSEAPRVFAR